MYKLIAIDCDGTLLNSNKEITQSTVDTLVTLKNADIKIVLASARPFYRLKKYLSKLGLLVDSQFTVAFNGSLIINNGTEEEIFSQSFTPLEIRELLEVSNSLNHDVFMYTKNGIFSNHQNLEYVNRNPDVNFSVVNLYELDFEAIKIYKFAFVNTPDKIKELRRRLPNNIINNFEVSSSVPQFVEVVKKNITKSFALETIGKILNIKKEEMVAFGDEDNDIPMMLYAGYSIAMGNATPVVKKIANFVTFTNDEDGVSYALKKLF